jgi:predicted peptidase
VKLRRGSAPAALIAASLLSVGCVSPRPPGHFSRQEERTSQSGVHYLRYTPIEYEEGTDRWPLILFLHGDGERGDDLKLVKQEGLARFLEGRLRFPFVVVSPQLPRRSSWEPARLLGLLDELVSSLRVDADRVYVTGLSSGALAAWELALTAPDRIAAIVPIATPTTPLDLCRMKGVAVWAFHAAQDGRVPARRSRKAIETFRACGGEARLTIYPSEGHDAWTQAYSDPALYEWLAAHRRRKPGD